MVAQGSQPLADRREAVAVGPPLVLLPAGADAELEAAAADDVDRRGHLGRERRVAEPGADDHVAEPDPLGAIASADRTVNDSNVISSVGSGTVWK